jgi:hypothetical protein
MQTQTPPRKPTDDWEAKRDEWVAAIDGLFAEVEAWAKKEEWLVQRTRKTVDEDRLGSYEVPVLTLQTSAGPLILEPIARYIIGAEGRIDLCAFPSFESAIIVRTDGHWRFASVPPSSDRPWSKEAFLEIALCLAVTR